MCYHNHYHNSYYLSECRAVYGLTVFQVFRIINGDLVSIVILKSSNSQPHCILVKIVHHTGITVHAGRVGK